MKNKSSIIFILIILTLSLFGSSPAPVHAQDWWNQNWSYRVTIEIDRDKIEDDFTDFPVLVYLNSSKINWTHVQDDLDDLRFIDGDDITQLYAELENYTVNDEAWIWVKIPNVYSMGVPETNQPFYLYYGNNAVSSWWNPEDVWEDSAVMVQHMTDNPDNAHITDSTQYDNNGIKKGANEPIETASGKIDSALSFDGIDDHADCGSGIAPTTGITLSAWINPDINDSWNQDSVITKTSLISPYLVWKIGITNTGKLRFDIRANGKNQSPVSANTIPINSWTFITGTFDGRYSKIYIDGIYYPASTFDLGGIYPIDDLNVKTYIGYEQSNGRYFNGIVDEVHIYNRALPAAEIKADYNSGADTLLIYGAEELCPLALTILYNTGINKLYINGTERANNTVIYIDKDVNVNATATLNKNYLFFKYMLDGSPDFVNPYMFNMTQSYTLWTYAVSEVNPKTAYDITMLYSPSGSIKTGTVYSFTAHAFIYNEGLESWNNYECKYKWYADNSIISYGDSNSNGIFIQDFNFGSEQTHIFRVVIFDLEDTGYLSPLYDETFDYISYTSGAEIMILVAMAISLSLAVLSVFIPLASIGAFIINFGYLVFNVNSVIELRELVIIVLFISTLIGFFGIYQTKGE